jgi:hypothetical protein
VNNLLPLLVGKRSWNKRKDSPVLKIPSVGHPAKCLSRRLCALS